jgi:hypothetical protein
MTAICPSGHVSATLDYCDQCGARIAATAPPDVSTPVVEELDTSPAIRHEPCPTCGAPRSGDDRYCEGCGHDFTLAAPPAARLAVWEAVASADREYFDTLGSEGIAFPADYAERRFPLALELVRIGRSRGREGEEIPEIDLASPPSDPGISHLHAAFERQGDGSYAARDLGSTNGTMFNDGPALLGTELTAPLADGDRIRIGAWTAITLRRR